MRTTSLNFRSPKERTPEYNDLTVLYLLTKVTYDGRKLNFLNPKPSTIRISTFPKERRFMEYLINEKRNNILVSPTSYNPNSNILNNSKFPCLVSYVFL